MSVSVLVKIQTKKGSDCHQQPAGCKEPVKEERMEGGRCVPLHEHELQLHVVGFSGGSAAFLPTMVHSHFFFSFINLVPLLSNGSSCEIQVSSLHIGARLPLFLAVSNVQISFPQGRLVGGCE